MNIAVPAVTAPPAGVIVVRSEKDLERFRDAASAAVVWDRSLPPDVSSMLADLRPEMMPDGRVVLQVKAVADAVRCLCDDAGMPAGKLRDWLVGDIAALAHSLLYRVNRSNWQSKSLRRFKVCSPLMTLYPCSTE